MTETTTITTTTTTGRIHLCFALIVLLNQMSLNLAVDFINSSQPSADLLLLLGAQTNVTLDSIPNATQTETETTTQTTTTSTPTADDVDLVISSSEILSSTFPANKQRHTTSADANTSHSASAAPNLFDLPDQSGAIETDDSVAQQSSRLLLQLLVLGLFTLVSSSLILVYAVKFCVCRRRKRLLLRRALVGDSSCSCSTPANNLLDLAEQCAVLQSARPSSSSPSSSSSPYNSRLLHSLLIDADRASTGNLSRQPVWSTPMARQPHVAATLQLHQHLSHLAQTFQLASTVGHRMECNQCQPTPQLASPGAPNDNLSPFSRPPTYSELFGPQTAGPSSINSDQIGLSGSCVVSRRRRQSAGANENNMLTTTTTTTTTNTINGAQPPAGSARLASQQPSSNNNSCNFSTSPSTSSSSSSTSSSANQDQQRQQVNLLVRLNLNKTKLLSPADLMLLSKLIDVPIVIQEGRQHQQQQQPPRPDGPSSSSSVNNDEEDEDDDDDDEGNYVDEPTPRRVRSRLEELARLQQLSVSPPSSTSRMDST